ncbi:MAG: hypothetical protein ACKVH8_04530 [Pirellulales bacterium]
MAFGHTDDVPNKFDPEAKPTPESSAVLHDIISFGTVVLILKNQQTNQLSAIEICH